MTDIPHSRRSPMEHERDVPEYLITVRPGPVLHVWRDGQEVAAVPLAAKAVLALIAKLLSETKL